LRAPGHAQRCGLWPKESTLKLSVPPHECFAPRATLRYQASRPPCSAGKWRTALPAVLSSSKWFRAIGQAWDSKATAEHPGRASTNYLIFSALLANQYREARHKIL